MFNVEKLVKAKIYSDKLANGIDPISGQQMPQDSVLNQVELVRYFFFLSGLLQDMIQSAVKPSSASNKKSSFFLTQSQLSRVELSSKPISMTDLTERISKVVDPQCKKFSYKWIVEWLVDAGFLIIDERNNKKSPTPAGEELGIFQEMRIGSKGQYLVTLYNEEAQQFVLDNMDSILKAQGYTVIP